MLLLLLHTRERLDQREAQDSVFASSPRTRVLVPTAAPFRFIWFLINTLRWWESSTSSQARVRESRAENVKGTDERCETAALQLGATGDAVA